MKHIGKKVLAIILAALMVAVYIPAGKTKDVEAADATVQITVTALYDYAYQVLDYVNQEREAEGLNALEMDVDLMNAALIRAAESAVVGAAYDHSEITNSVAHTRPDGQTFYSVNGKQLGENIAYGQSTPYKVMYNDGKTDMDGSSWMRSQGHKNNILDPDWNSVGIGVVYYAGNYYYYWSQEFGSCTATVPEKRTDRESLTFNIGVTSDVYTRLVNRGVIEESADDAADDMSSDTAGGEATGETDGSVTGQWRLGAGGWWFDLGDGNYLKNCWLKSGSNWYAFDGNGYMFTDWVKIDGTWYYFYPDGHMASNEWIEGYWLGANGAWTYEWVGSWHADSSGWWYSDASGWYPWSAWQKIDGKWYYFDYYGYMVSNGVIDGYFLGADGAMITN